MVKERSGKTGWGRRGGNYVIVGREGSRREVLRDGRSGGMGVDEVFQNNEGV